MIWTGGMRWSSSERGWLGFFASMTNGRVMLRHELTWKNVTPENAAREVHEKSAEWHLKLKAIYAQPEIFPDGKDYGETVSETFARSGLPMMRGGKDRVAGWQRLRSWLEPKPWADGLIEPALLIHPDCAYFLRTLPTLVVATTDPDDVSESPEEYPASGARYFVMSRPLPGMPQPEVKQRNVFGEMLHKRLSPRRKVIGSDNVRAVLF